MYFSTVRIRPEIFQSTQFAKIVSGNAYSTHRLLWDLFPGQKQRGFLYREEIAREQLGRQAGARGEPVYYLVSSSAPSEQSPFFIVNTKPYDPKLQEGETLRFELRANPVVTKNGKKHDVVMDAQQSFLRRLSEEMNLQSLLESSPEKSEYKKTLLAEGDKSLDRRLTSLLENDRRYAELLDQRLPTVDKLEWSLKAAADDALEKWMTRQAGNNGFSIMKNGNGEVKLQSCAYRWHALPKKASKGAKSGFSSVDFTGDLKIVNVEATKRALFRGIGRSKAFGCGLLLVKRI